MAPPALIESQRFAGERIALPDVAGLQPSAEPADSLVRASVGERVGHDIPLSLALQPVVADRRRGTERRLDVAGFEDLAALLGMVQPDAGQEVGLELDPDREP